MRKLIVMSVALLVAGAVTAGAAEAKAIWAKDCAKCHGPDGKGETAVGRMFHIKDFSKPEVQKAVTDEQMTKDIKDGVTEGGHRRMKGFGDQLSESEIKALVKYMRGFKK
jgi:cytochrome c553